MKILIRVDQKCGKDEMIGKIKSLIDKYGKGIASFENPEDRNPHFHIWMETDSTVQSVRDKFKRMFEVSGNAEYSMSTKDGSLKYICKDGDIVYNTWFTDDEVKTAKESWLSDEQFKEKHGKKKKEKESNFKAALEYVRENVDQPDPWLICENLIQYYHEKCKCEPNDFQLKCMTKSIVREYYAKTEKWAMFKRRRAKDIIGSEFIYEF